MIVTLKGTTTNIEVTFLDHKNYVYNYGYKNYNNCYVCNTINTLNFKATNFAGFWDNLKTNPTTDKGVGEIGSVWRGSSLDERLITWNFTPVVENYKSVAPQQILNALINANEVIEVIVDNSYSGYYYFLSDTSSENGVISMASADVNYGTFWSKGVKTFKYYILEQEAYITKTLPQVLLANGEFPYTIEFFSESLQTPKVTLGGTINGVWESFYLETNEQMLKYDNSINKDDYIIIDSDNLTIINEHGTDRSNDVDLFSGTSKFPLINFGFNTWKFNFNNANEYSDLDLCPTDLRLEVEYEELTSSISYETRCNV